MKAEQKPESSPLRARLHDIIFEAETVGGRAFDIALLVLICLSVMGVLLETVPEFQALYGRQLYLFEWFITIIFTVEYALRLFSVQRPWRYATSFYGVIDALAILPTYLSLFLAGAHYLIVVRILRLLRIFRIFKLARYVAESHVLVTALRASLPKITVFLFSVVNLVVIIGALMYLVEGPASGFTSIPVSMYWAIVTLTTVGYGDIAPQTPLGQLLACLVMILGYGIIAVPTGIVTVELSQQGAKSSVTTQVCPVCSRYGHDPDAIHCKFCGATL